ncbi:MAG: lysophospholipid acyltransferase family protein [Bacteroidetes bacterium]|nr:lysophospholipid acyltransferase family protein [Bacteroidota bacterium]
MKAVLYYLSLPFIYVVSSLPLWLLFGLSDMLYVLIYKLLSYRLEVVRQNLQNSFPNKTANELRLIEKHFYRYFCDMVLESLKPLTISEKKLREMVLFQNIEMVAQYFEKKQSIIIVMGHFGNWELGGARFSLEKFHELFMIYQPLKNPYFNALTQRLRTRFGNGLFTKKDTMRGMMANRNKTTATIFIADQTPTKENAIWMNFLNQETAVYQGAGKIAQKFNYPVLYAAIKREKRGQYKVNFKEICQNSAELAPKQIMARFMAELAKDINELPSTWLWTHKRWKHKRIK